MRCDQGKPASRNRLQALAQLQNQLDEQRPADPLVWWEQLMQEDADLQWLESIMTVINIRYGHWFWTLLHDRSESLSRRMAECIDLLKEREPDA